MFLEDVHHRTIETVMDHRSSAVTAPAPRANPRFLPRHDVPCDVNPTGTKRTEYRRPFSSRRKLPSSHHSWRAPPSIMYPRGQVSARPSGCWLPVRIYLAFSSATSFLSVIYICMLVCISLQNLFPWENEQLAFTTFLCNRDHFLVSERSFSSSCSLREFVIPGETSALHFIRNISLRQC